MGTDEDPLQAGQEAQGDNRFETQSSDCLPNLPNQNFTISVPTQPWQTARMTPPKKDSPN